MSLIYPTKSLEAYPKHLSPEYKSTVKRSPSKPLMIIPHTLSELTGPVYGHDAIQENDNDLTKQILQWRAGRRVRFVENDDSFVILGHAEFVIRHAHGIVRHAAEFLRFERR